LRFLFFDERVKLAAVQALAIYIILLADSDDRCVTGEVIPRATRVLLYHVAVKMLSPRH
jgi:hypothetical protein